MSINLKMKIVRDLIEGLKYLHSNLPEKRPILHKDLKPANLLLSSDGNLIIIDLGIGSLTKENDL